MQARKPLTALACLFLLCVVITLAGTSCQAPKPDVFQGRFSTVSKQKIEVGSPANYFYIIVLVDGETGVQYVVTQDTHGLGIAKLEK